MKQKENTKRDLFHDAKIRLLTSHDAQLIDTFYKKVHPQTRRIFGKYRFTMEHAQEIAQAAKDNPSKRYYGVILGGASEEEPAQMVGLFWFWKWTFRLPWFGIMIADLYQGQGLGTKMMAYAIAEAKNHNKGGILLTTAKTNFNAQSLYKRYKFEVIGEATNGEHLLILNFPDLLCSNEDGVT